LKTNRHFIIVFLLISICCLSVFIYRADGEKREIKEDLIEISNIKYGLFNVDEWKIILSNILSKKIEEFEVDGKNRKQMKIKISDFLYKVISDMETRYYEENSSSITGILKIGVANITGTFGKIKKDIPIFTEQILNFFNDPNNKKALKSYLSGKLDEYTDNTFAKIDYSLHDSIINKYNFGDRAATILSLDTRLETLQQTANNYKYVLIVLSIFTAAFILFTKIVSKTEFILITITCTLFLILGLTLPMIEIDARVSEIKISLLGEQINFQDQVLYYKSKSILEIIRLMIGNGGFDLILVGFLVFIFSVLFPILKLVSSVFLVSIPSLHSNKIINFLVNKTGKCSMADVMVVAIFMSYIRFSGILPEQLLQLENLSSKIDVLTTNKSSLQTGFFAFTAFALLSLLTTGKIKKIQKNSSDSV